MQKAAPSLQSRAQTPPPRGPTALCQRGLGHGAGAWASPGALAGCRPCPCASPAAGLPLWGPLLLQPGQPRHTEGYPHHPAEAWPQGLLPQGWETPRGSTTEAGNKVAVLGAPYGLPPPTPQCLPTTSSTLGLPPPCHFRAFLPPHPLRASSCPDAPEGTPPPWPRRVSPPAQQTCPASAQCWRSSIGVS